MSNLSVNKIFGDKLRLPKRRISKKKLECEVIHHFTFIDLISSNDNSLIFTDRIGTIVYNL